MPELIDIKTRLDDAKSDFSGLKDRQLIDDNLVNNEPYKFKDWKGDDVPRVFSVTLPNAGIYSSKMVGIISGVNRQPVVKSETWSDEQKADFTTMLQDIDIEIDDILNSISESDAFTTHSRHFCNRGWGGELILLHMEDGELVTDVRPLDPYSWTFTTDRKGLTLISYETPRSRGKIGDQYGVVVPDRTGLVKVAFDKNWEYVFINGALQTPKKNKYGYVPAVVQHVDYGPGTRQGEDNLKRKGESIFYPHRDMFQEMNWMASLLKTQSFDDLRPALQKLMVGSNTKKPKKYPSSQSLTIVDAPIDLVPRRDMTNAMRTFMNMIDSILQRAGLSSINEGTLTFPIAAILFARLMAERNSLTLPRFQAMGSLYRRRTRMIVKQLIEIGGSFDIGEEGMKRSYNTKDLKGSYTVSWNYRVKSLEDDATRASIGTSQRGLISDKTIRLTTLELENPEKEENLLEIQEAKREHPLFKDLETILSLIEQDTDESDAEARMLFFELMTVLRQRITGGVEEPKVQEPVKAGPQIPVFGGGGGGSGRAASPEATTEEA